MHPLLITSLQNVRIAQLHLAAPRAVLALTTTTTTTTLTWKRTTRPNL
jgi:hypothetical protein